MSDMRQFTATPTVEELEPEIERLEAEIERLKKVVGNQRYTLDAQRKETERLRAERNELFMKEQGSSLEIERLRAALRTIASHQMRAWGDEFQEGINSQAEIARAALDNGD